MRLLRRRALSIRVEEELEPSCAVGWQVCTFFAQVTCDAAENKRVCFGMLPVLFVRRRC
jgi:hypothetical protein